WGLVGVMGVLMSVDEGASIHEFILQSAHLFYYGEVVPTAALNAWWLALPFIVAGGLWFAWWIYRHLPRRTVGLFVLAGMAYFSGAAGFELVCNDFAKSSFMYQGWMPAFEESLELVGSAMALCAIISYLETEHAAK